MNIVMSFSTPWAEYAKVTIHSINKTNKADKIYLLTDEPGDYPDNCIQLNPTALLEKHITTKINYNCIEKKYCFYKLMLSKIINEPKALYIDADALVIGDVSEYYNANLDGYVMAGVEDIGLAPGYKQKIGLEPSDTYINAGIILFNMEELDKQFDELMHKVNTKWYLGNEQCMLNTTCKGKILTVDNKYNSSLSTGYSDDIRIIHYAGPKPWAGQAVRGEIWHEWRVRYKK